MEGWATGAGRLGADDDGPEGGARFNAGLEGAEGAASGTDAGGTGGGRSVNIWAETEAGITAASKAASASAEHSCAHHPDPLIAFPPDVMPHAFH
jgi:hypothetical protein